MAKTAKKETAAEPKFHVGHLADALGIEETTTRIRLRNAKVARPGKSYGWNSQKEFDAVVNKLKNTRTATTPKKTAPAKAASARKGGGKGKGQEAREAA